MPTAILPNGVVLHLPYNERKKSDSDHARQMAEQIVGPEKRKKKVQDGVRGAVDMMTARTRPTVSGVGPTGLNSSPMSAPASPPPSDSMMAQGNAPMEALRRV